jgi:exopolysaccharide biosynthesis polyprenyl glycosylphosphotransferase
VLRRALAVADLLTGCAIGLSFVVFDQPSLAIWSVIYVPVWILLAKLHGLYDRDHRALRHLTVDEFPSIMGWAMSGTAALAALLMIAPGVGLSLPEAARCWLVAVAVGTALRFSARLLWRRATPRERTLIVGRGPLAAAVRRKLTLFPDTHAVVVAEMDDQGVDDLCEQEDLQANFDRVVLATNDVKEHQIAELVGLCRRQRIKLTIVPPARGMFDTAAQLRHIADLPVIEYNTWDVSRSTLLLKRIVDVIVSACALALISPLLALISLAVLLDSRGPIFFVQSRAGLNGHPFRMIKFRTMVPDAVDKLDGLVRLSDLHEPMFKLANDPRVTRVGSLLRKASLDELPQLINVLVGSMSLVGPRPEQVELVDLYQSEHMFRLSVKPGLTGPMQVFGRGQLSFQERLAVEREYIENLSIGRDLRILALTIPSVMSGRGAS